RRLDGPPGRVDRQARPALPEGVLELGDVPVAADAPDEGDGDGEREEREGRDDRALEHAAARDAGVLDAGLELRDRGRAGLRVALDRVALVDLLVVGHEDLRPVHGTEADAQQREGDGEAERERRQAHARGRPVRRDDEVHDERDDRADRRDAEERRHLPLGALRSPRVAVRLAALVLGQARVRERVQGAVLLAVPDLAVRGLGRPGVLVVAHEDFAPIHTAAPTRRPIPTIQAHRPSLTGPSEPSERPPAEPSRWSTRNAMTSRFSSGVMVASLKTGIDWGPVSIAW